MKLYFYLQLNLLFCVLPLYLNAQSLSPMLNGSRHRSLGNASVALRDAQSLFSNPAGLLGVENNTLILNSAWFYGVRELKPIAAGFVLKNATGVMGFTFKHFGFESLQDNSFGVAYARRFSSKLDAGIHLNYSHLKIIDNGSHNGIDFDLGFNLLIIKDLYIAFHAQNPVPLASSNLNSTPSVLRLGLAYFMNTSLLLSGEVLKELSAPASFRMGMAYKPTPKMEFRGGIETQPIQLSFGFGYVLSDHLNADLAVSNHSILGSSPSLSIHYVFKK